MKNLLMLLCSYPSMKVDKNVLAGYLKEIQNWSMLLRLINDHGIISLSSYNIKEACLESHAPDNFINGLRNGLIQNAARNSWLVWRWKEINHILITRGIKHVLLKGMALEHTKYESRGLRQMNDVDIFIRREDALSAWHLLQENGFQYELKSALHKKIILDIGKHLPALSKDGFTVEIHHKLFDDKAKNRSLEQEFQNAMRISIEGTEAFVFHDEIHSAFLVEHLQNHMQTGEFQMRLFADLVLFGQEKKISIPEHFIRTPVKKKTYHFRRIRYIKTFYSVSVQSRLRFIIGDVFASPGWIMKTYRIGPVLLPLYYLARLLRTAVLVLNIYHNQSSLK